MYFKNILPIIEKNQKLTNQKFQKCLVRFIGFDLGASNLIGILYIVLYIVHLTLYIKKI